MEEDKGWVTGEGVREVTIRISLSGGRRGRWDLFFLYFFIYIYTVERDCGFSVVKVQKRAWVYIVIVIVVVIVIVYSYTCVDI